MAPRSEPEVVSDDDPSLQQEGLDAEKEDRQTATGNEQQQAANELGDLNQDVSTSPLHLLYLAGAELTLLYLVVIRRTSSTTLPACLREAQRSMRSLRTRRSMPMWGLLSRPMRVRLRRGGIQ